jgi:hypothetical protein
MKTSARILIVLVICFTAVLCSCEQVYRSEQGSGTAEFSIMLLENQSVKSLTSDSTLLPAKIMISVADMSGNSVLTDKVVSLYKFGTEYISESIQITAGQYKLTKFMVINSAGTVIYASPLAGSPLAYLSTKPLPITFSIMLNQVTKVLPGVLPVGTQTPDQFGYAAFGFQIINPMGCWVICTIDNPASASPTQLTTANLTVAEPSGWRFTYRLQAAPNNLTIRGGSELYNLIVEKEGYAPQNLQVSAEVLKATTQANPLIIKIPLTAAYKVIVLQPGPEKGKDAMISNLEPDKNFGDHKYFEATFLSEPVLTVMRSNRSLIAFNLDTIPKSAVIKRVVLTLSYDLPIPFDITTFKPDVYPSTGIAWYGGVLQQVTEQWEEGKVTWKLTPKTTEVNQVFIAPFIRNTNLIDVDVTRLFVPVSITTTSVATPNYGMLFRLWPEEKFPGFRFASSDFSEPKMRPKLTVYYTI